MMAEPNWTVGILIFEDVEVLDFCGPFEVFALARLPVDGPGAPAAPAFRVVTLAERGDLVRCRGGLLVQPNYTLAEHPPLDILLVPGGPGTARQLDNPRLLSWIPAQNGQTRLTLSVCTGALLLAACGLLDGQAATTHWAALDRLREGYPAVTVRDGVRYVDSGRIITAAGVTAGINMALHVVGSLLGEEASRRTAHEMEHTFAPATSQGGV